MNRVEEKFVSRARKKARKKERNKSKGRTRTKRETSIFKRSEPRLLGLAKRMPS